VILASIEATLDALRADLPCPSGDAAYSSANCCHSSMDLPGYLSISARASLTCSFEYPFVDGNLGLEDGNLKLEERERATLLGRTSSTGSAGGGGAFLRAVATDLVGAVGETGDSAAGIGDIVGGSTSGTMSNAFCWASKQALVSWIC
jgi:hypothetical protein